MKNKFKNILPVIIVTVITAFVSIGAYYKLLHKEYDKCSRILADSADSMSKEIRIRFEDNINLLRILANRIQREGNFNSKDYITKLIQGADATTIFSRVYVIYPNNTVLFPDGNINSLAGDITFEEISEQGEHMSSRKCDILTGEYVIYYDIPITKDGETSAIIVGVIDCSTLSDLFHTSMYNGNTAEFIVDSKDGSILMNSLNSKLGNINTMIPKNEFANKSQEEILSDVMNEKSGFVSYSPLTNGNDSIVHYSPVGIFDWELLVIVEEDVAFSSLTDLKHMLAVIGCVEILLLIIYFVWNLRTVKLLAKSNAETRRQLENSNALIDCVTELSSNQNIDAAIDNLLSIIDNYFGGDRAYIFDFDYEKGILTNTYEYAAEGISKEIDNLQNVPLHLVNGWIEKFKTDGSFYISSLEKKKNDEAAYEVLKAQNIESLIAVPLMRGKQITGFVGVDNPKKNYRDLTLLSSIQFFITSSLDTKQQQEQLEYLSYNDVLTKLYNRNKYTKTVEYYTTHSLSRIGAAYMDLNGLKETNDKLGHEAGDELIRKTAEQFVKEFPKHSYRTGGDEFVVLHANIDKHEFYRKVETLVKNLKKNGISISYGILWKEKCDNLELMLNEADKLMYENKKEFYSNSKYDRRKSRRE